jgi:hypothetical protein
MPTQETAQGEGTPGTATPEAGSRPKPDTDYERRFIATLEDLVKQADPTPHRWFAAAKARDPIGRLVNVSRQLSDMNPTPSLWRQACFAADTIARGTPYLPRAAAVLDDLDFATSKHSPVSVVMQGMVKALQLLLALLGVLIAGTWLVFVGSAAFGSQEHMRLSLNASVLFVTQELLGTPVFFAILFGVLGSVVSIILQLSDLARTPRTSRQFLLLTGMLLPIVGGIFALIAYAIFRAGLLSVFSVETVKAEHQMYFVMVIGFLAGFSERFTRGLLGSRSDNLTALQQEQQPSGDPSSDAMNNAVH